MVRASDYVEDSRIRWGALSTVLFGTTILAYVEGATRVILALADIPISMLAWLGTFAANVVGAYFGIAPAVVWQAWFNTIPLVRGGGPAAFALSILIALSAAYVFWRVIGYGE